MRSRRWSRGVVTLAVAALAVAALAITPGNTASFLTKGKAKKLFYTKGGADARFLNIDEAVTTTASSGSFVSTTSTTPGDLPGASVGVTTPGPSLITADFSAYSACYGGAPATVCRVTVLIDGVAAQPGGGAQNLDASGAGAERESHSLTAFGTVGAGTHTVKAQWSVQSTNTFELYGWTLVVQTSPA